MRRKPNQIWLREKETNSMKKRKHDQTTSIKGHEDIKKDDTRYTRHENLHRE